MLADPAGAGLAQTTAQGRKVWEHSGWEDISFLSQFIWITSQVFNHFLHTATLFIYLFEFPPPFPCFESFQGKTLPFAGKAILCRSCY